MGFACFAKSLDDIGYTATYMLSVIGRGVESASTEPKSVTRSGAGLPVDFGLHLQRDSGVELPRVPRLLVMSCLNMFKPP